MPNAGDPVPGQPGSFYNQFGGIYQQGLPALTQSYLQQYNPGALPAYQATLPSNQVIPASPQTQLSTPAPAQRTNLAIGDEAGNKNNALPRLIVQNSNGRVDTARLDGTDPRGFASWSEFQQYAQQSGESYIGDQAGGKNAITESQAVAMAREWTGDKSYNGAKGLSSMADYRPPTVQNGSPASRGINVNEWLPTATSNPFGKSYQPSPPPTTAPPGPGTTTTPSPGAGPGPGPTPGPGGNVVDPTGRGAGNISGISSPITPTTTVTPPTAGGIGNPSTTVGPNAASLPPNASWQDILKYLTNFGLNRSQGSNNLIDLATQQLTNAQGRTNAIDAQQSTVSNFINSMISQANSASGTRDQLVQGILNNTGLANGPGGATTPTVMQNAATLLNQMLQSSTPGTNPNTGQPGSGQLFDPTGYRNDQINAFINLAGQVPPGMTDESKAALRLNQSELIPQQFNDAISQARQQLQTQGALGGEQPGSQSDMTRILAPIYAARGTAYSQLNANNILQNEALRQQQLQQQRQLGLGALGQGVSLDQMSLQNLLSNRGLANQLISTLGGITTGTAGLYNPAQYNALAQGGIGDLINMINSGTGALQTGNQAVNAATGAYAAGNQPLQTATGAGETLAQNSPSSLTSLLLNALLSAGVANSGGIGKAIGSIDWGKIFGGGTGGTGGNAPFPPVNIPPPGTPGTPPTSPDFTSGGLT